MAVPEPNLKKEGRNWGSAPGTQERVRGEIRGDRSCPDPALHLPHPRREARVLRTDPGLILAQESWPGPSRAPRQAQTLECMPQGNRELGEKAPITSSEQAPPSKAAGSETWAPPCPPSVPVSCLCWLLQSCPLPPESKPPHSGPSLSPLPPQCCQGPSPPTGNPPGLPTAPKSAS